MRAEYDFSNARRSPYARKLRQARPRRLPGERGADDLPPLTRAKTRELERRIRDPDNPVRYVIESRLLPGARFRLFYSVSDDVWATDVTSGTLFKRRAAAVAVKALLSGRTRVVRLVLTKTRGGSRERARKQ